MYLTYIRRELRRRSKQAIVIAIGLAIGIGLVMTVSATSAGVKAAQGKVLHSLYGVGTDMTVTKTAAAGKSGFEHFGNFNFGRSSSTTHPKAGTHLSRNSLTAEIGQATLPASDVTKVASLDGVSAATGGLQLTDTSFSGTIPSFNSSGGFSSSSGSSVHTNFNIGTFTVDGIQITKSGVGPLTSSDISKGKFFTTADNTKDVAIVSSSYATQEKLKVGSDLKVAGKELKVIGIASTGSSSTDVYIPLGTAQKLAKMKNDVTTIYVSATSANDVSTVASAVHKVLPKATVTTSATLANEVSGSIKSAANLASKLGKWLSFAALIVAFIIAGLLMMAAVSRRVREFGTLKAIGWRTRRIVSQVMGEGVALGLGGGVLGILLGIGGSSMVSAISPKLSATVGPSFDTSGGASPVDFGNGGGGAPFGGSFPGASSHRPSAHGVGDAARSVAVHLTAPLQGNDILLAVVLAVAGGVVAGAFGCWRAARLRPAAALRRIE